MTRLKSTIVSFEPTHGCAPLESCSHLARVCAIPRGEGHNQTWWCGSKDHHESRHCESSTEGTLLSHKERDKLKDTHCKYTPYRASGEAKTYIAPVPTYEGTLNNVRGLLAAINTTLDDTNNTLHAAQQQIITLELQKRALEAALLNKEQLVVEDTVEACTSPSPYRPHYDSPEARTQDMPWEDSP
jgi:hypothetical protein